LYYEYEINQTILEIIMVVENQTETVLKDLANIQQRFVHENRRFRKGDLLEKFINDESLSQEARNLTSEAVDRLYEDVVWEDDVFGTDLGVILEVLIARYRLTHS
jgi:hypothetical protein